MNVEAENKYPARLLTLSSSGLIVNALAAAAAIEKALLAAASISPLAPVFGGISISYFGQEETANQRSNRLSHEESII